jgi:hypothetical protein
VSRSPISLSLPEDCALFIQDLVFADPGPPPGLPSEELCEIFASGRIELRPPIPEPRHILELSRTQAIALLGWLQSAHDALPARDERRRLCAQCLDRVAGALRLAGG